MMPGSSTSSGDNGSGLALIFGEDRFRVLPPEPQTLKFYMPLTAQLYGRDDWGDMEEYGNELDGRELRKFAGNIRDALLGNRTPEESARGLMHWYDKQDGVEAKVQSVVFEVEDRDGQLWGVAKCKVIEELLPEEKETLAEYIRDKPQMAGARASSSGLSDWTKENSMSAYGMWATGASRQRRRDFRRRHRHACRTCAGRCCPATEP